MQYSVVCANKPLVLAPWIAPSPQQLGACHRQRDPGGPRTRATRLGCCSSTGSNRKRSGKWSSIVSPSFHTRVSEAKVLGRSAQRARLQLMHTTTPVWFDPLGSLRRRADGVDIARGMLARQHILVCGETIAENCRTNRRCRYREPAVRPARGKV
jgi:hypothetical protein